MKLTLFSIYDSKAQSFAAPFPAANKGAAIRTVVDAIKDGDSLLARHPADFSLFWVGEFDQDEGLIGAVSPAPQNMGVLTQFLPVTPAGEDRNPPELLKLMGGK